MHQLVASSTSSWGERFYWSEIRRRWTPAQVKKSSSIRMRWGGSHFLPLWLPHVNFGRHTLEGSGISSSLWHVFFTVVVQWNTDIYGFKHQNVMDGFYFNYTTKVLLIYIGIRRHFTSNSLEPKWCSYPCSTVPIYLFFLFISHLSFQF